MRSLMADPLRECPLGRRAVQDALLPLQDTALAVNRIPDFFGELCEERDSTKSAPSLERLRGKTPPVGEFKLA